MLDCSAIKKDQKMIRLFTEGFYSGIKEFGANVSNVTNFILLFFVYLFGVGITAIVAKIFGKHFLQLKTAEKKSYWTEIKNKKPKMEEFYRQF